MKLVPTEIPVPEAPDSDTIVNKIVDFLTGMSPTAWAWIICGVAAIIGIKMWKKPLGKGIILGMIAVVLIYAFMQSK